MSNPTPAGTQVPNNLSADQARTLLALATPLLSGQLDRLSGVTGLHRYNGSGKLVGTALTVKTRPGDNLGFYHALAVMRPGHVLVVDGGGDLNNALCGDIMRAYAVSRGCAGFVVDGAIRDVATFAGGDFPCYARGVVHRGPYKSGPAQLCVPVSIGGQVIGPGDVVVGDEDGLVSFPASMTASVIARAQDKLRVEQGMLDEIAGGDERQSWLHDALKGFGIDV